MTSTLDSPRWFYLWLAARSVVLPAVAALTFTNVSLDVTEMLAFGREWQPGYYKHPALPAWLAEAAVSWCPGSVWPCYFLGFVVTAAGLLAAYRMARERLRSADAFWAVVCLDGLTYVTNDAVEFNNNVPLNAGWAWMVVLLYRALTRGGPGWWAAYGVSFGLAVQTKYTAALLLFCQLGYVLLHPAYRRAFRTPGPYLAAAAAAVLVAPNAYWVVTHDFLPLKFADERTSEPGPWTRRLFFPAQFVGGQTYRLLPVLFVLFPLLSWRTRRYPPHPAERYLRFVVFAPVVAMLGISIATASLLREIWGSQLWLNLGGWLLMRFRAAEDVPARRVAWRWAVVAVGMVGLIVGKQYALPHLSGEPERVHFPGRRLADEVNARWQSKFGGLPPVVGGESWRAGCVCAYSPHRPHLFGKWSAHVMIADPTFSPWVTDGDVRKHGAVFVWDPDRESEANLADLKARFPGLEAQPEIRLPYQSSAPLGEFRTALAFVPPQR